MEKAIFFVAAFKLMFSRPEEEEKKYTVSRSFLGKLQHFCSSSGLENLSLKAAAKNLAFSIHYCFRYRIVCYVLFGKEVLCRSFYFCFMYVSNSTEEVIVSF